MFFKKSPTYSREEATQAIPGVSREKRNGGPGLLSPSPGGIRLLSSLRWVCPPLQSRFAFFPDESNLHYLLPLFTPCVNSSLGGGGASILQSTAVVGAWGTPKTSAKQRDCHVSVSLEQEPTTVSWAPTLFWTPPARGWRHCEELDRALAFMWKEKHTLKEGPFVSPNEGCALRMDIGREHERLGGWGPIIILRPPWQWTSESVATAPQCPVCIIVESCCWGGFDSAAAPTSASTHRHSQTTQPPSLASGNYASRRLICKETARQLF